MNQSPLVLLACDHSADVGGLINALSSFGINGRACTDRPTLERWVDAPGALNGLIGQAPFVTPADLSAMRANVPEGALCPAFILVVPDDDPTTLAEALMAGVDVPIVGAVAAKTVVDTTVMVIERQRAQYGQELCWELDEVAWQLAPPNGTPPVPLTFKERGFLLKLAQAPGEPLPKETFVDLFCTTSELFDPRRLEIMVRRLRNKVRKYTKQELPLHTAHGVGYALGTPLRMSGAQLQGGNHG